MSTQSPAVVPATNSTQFIALQEKFEAIDKFASEQNISAILDGQGGFMAALKIASAMEQLRQMITDDMMKPIMSLQGSALGFRTDKDTEGGYPVAVVKEVLIEATMKGFRLTGNESNVIGGRFYPTKEGFERFFRDLSKKTGQFTDLRMAPGVPRTTGDGAIVDYHASWVFKNIKDELKLQIPIRVNKGQGPDAILGKARRKMLAAIYSRVTGTEITDGDVDDPKTVDVSATEKREPAPAPVLPPETVHKLEELIGTHEAEANKFLVSNGSIQDGQTFRNVTAKVADNIIRRTAAFFEAAGIK